MENNAFAFTRYLYFKKEVEISLVTCILEKKNEAEFWAYELYYSGYQEETISLLWKIYYYFFATLNPSFEAYFIKKQKENPEDETIIATIVNNLIIRPFNLDVFLLHKINTHLDIEDEEEEGQQDESDRWSKYVETKDFLNISKMILLDCSSPKTLNKLSECCSIEKDKVITQTKSWQKIINHHPPDQTMSPIILISKLMGFFTKQEQKPKGKNFYVIIEPAMIEKYKTIVTTNAAYQTLPKVCLYSIDPTHYLSLFEIPRHAEQKPMDMYHYKWLYYASFSPVWAARIQEYRGTVNHPKKVIEFGTEDNMELFYERYGYEPDEQKIEIQHRNIQPIQNVRTWQSVYDQHVESGIVRISSDIMEALDRIRF